MFCDTLAVINLIAVFTFVKRAKALQCSDWSHAVGGGGEAPLVRTPTPDTAHHHHNAVTEMVMAMVVMVELLII